MPRRLAKDLASFADLASDYEADKDFRIIQVPRPESATAVLAPHGGGIQAHTSDIARAIAGSEFGLYLFEGLLRAGNFTSLRLRGDRFDEPGCLQMLQACDRVVSVHGLGSPGEVVLLSGRDLALSAAIAERLVAAGLTVEEAPARLSGSDPNHVCNRGRSGAGVLVEISMDLRRSRRRVALVRAVREALLGGDTGASAVPAPMAL
ncbi:poly-gamma-glutamate hydrolase family protein [Aquabacterium sp.]|uniref:poly-gamma-glutamate hydrolase family protein n=1 Tax=Aquabacterium sp. TaxID=1872578 RepID=UPI002C0A7EEC|nr:poly-gamma-glutamate hydrolase family protein [Aquabacterium sp.]HSW03689.1 poly-gamma-glutamate hydrolase family protein [Aquabacterium sp.]